MNRIHPTLQPVLDAFAQQFSPQGKDTMRRVNELAEMRMLADRIAEVTTLPMTKRDVAAIVFVALKKWSER